MSSTENQFYHARQIVRDPNAYDLRPAEVASIAAVLREVDRLRWRLAYIRENRNDQTAIACALECSDAQADDMRRKGSDDC